MKLFKQIDLMDIFTFLGLILIWYGSFLLSPPISFIIVGSILFVLGFLGASRGGEK